MAVVGAACSGVFPTTALAQEGPAPAAVLTVDPAAEVDLGQAPQLESPPLPEGAFISRPTIPIDEYRQLKQSAGKAAAKARRPQTEQPLATTLVSGANGQSQGAPGPSLFPPDSAGAAGNTQIAQALNSKFAVYTKANPPALQCANSFATLTGFTTTTLFDPRVVYDNDWDRWVISVEAFPESASVQRQFLLISMTANACGSYRRYSFDVNFANTSSFFWDFPDLGLTQDAVILTANIFNPGFVGSATAGFAKARLYNGLGFSVPVFTGLGGTLAPPMVLDQDPCANLLQVLTGTSLGRRTFCNAENAFFGSVSAAASVPVSNTISVPPNAPQPGCTATSTCALDTSDARFSSQTWQNGDNLWATHTITDAGLPTPKYYQIDIAGAGINTVKSQAFFFDSATSSDFNASIAARTNDTIYVGWNSSSSSTFVRVLVGGKTAAGAFARAIALTGTVALTGNFDPNFGSQRWGDYSNTWPDNSVSTQAWSFAERVNTAATWGTRLQRFAQT